MLEAAIEAGADDCESTEDGHEITCAPDELAAVQEKLEADFGAAGAGDPDLEAAGHRAGRGRQGRGTVQAARGAGRQRRRAAGGRELRGLGRRAREARRADRARADPRPRPRPATHRLGRGRGPGQPASLRRCGRRAFAMPPTTSPPAWSGLYRGLADGDRRPPAARGRGRGDGGQPEPACHRSSWAMPAAWCCWPQRTPGSPVTNTPPSRSSAP